jgi:hypothetical protein
MQRLQTSVIDFLTSLRQCSIGRSAEVRRQAQADGEPCKALRWPMADAGFMGQEHGATHP